MNDYSFNKIPHAPFDRGKTPELAWYLIEPVNRNEYEMPVDDDPKSKTRRVMEVYDAETARVLADEFDLDDWMGIGAPVNRDHLHITGSQGTESYGWIKALHATEDGLWACIEWTEEGRDLVNKGKYAFFSTEYPFADYILDGSEDEESGLPIARPGRLTGLAITNYPANRRQMAMTRSARTRGLRCRCAAIINNHPNKQDMNPKTKKATRSRSEDEIKQEETTAEEEQKQEETTEETKTNSEESKEEETQCNEEDLEFWTSLLSKLGLDPEDTDIDKEDILAAVDALAADNADLREKLKTNRAKAGVANRLSRLGFRSRREGKAPEETPEIKPGEMNPAQKEMAAHVAKHVKEVRARRENLGQPWRPEDYSAAVSAAQSEWMRKNPGRIS